jgi:hypothetical protein
VWLPRRLRLKPAGDSADRGIMRRRNEVTCPVCSADMPLSGDEKSGDDVFCTVCGAPCILNQSEDSEDFDVEEDC